MSASPNSSVSLSPPLGAVYLIGGGPGDPGLLTLRGRDLLARADVVLYDYLVNADVLAHAPASAEKICLGRHGKGKIWTQTEINARLVADSQAGRCVARLKGGDPAIFGRLAEEIDALEAAGVPYEIVPGVTAAQAAASYAGAPLTDREEASAVAFVAGHEKGEKVDALDYASLARFPGTLVFYMGVTRADVWSRALIEHGRPADEPAVIVRRVSWPDQRVVRSTLGGLAEALDQRRPDRIRPPALVIVGPVAARVRDDNWFVRRPLFGRTILVTRAAEQAGDLAGRLRELGAEVLIQPAIEIGPPDDGYKALDAVLARVEEFDWIVFSSTNGVQAFCDRLWKSADLRRLGRAKLAAIGPATADALAKYHLRCDLTPAEYRAESLAAELAGRAAGRRFLLVRASRGREILAEELSRAGGTVEQVVAYSSRDVTSPDPEVLAALESGAVHWTIVTSSAIARSLVGLCGEKLRQTKLATISPITSDVLRELGYEPAAEAAVYTMEGLVEALIRAES